MNRTIHFITTTILALSLLLSGCGGRLDDSSSGAVNFSQFNLQPGKPALIAFGALWCKPCREEIASLNQANSDFSSSLQVVQYLVEGSIEGTQPASDDADRFTSKEGIKPKYRVGLDPDWTIFQTLSPPKKALPLIVFVSGDGAIHAMIQRSMDYDTELKPWIERLMSGLPPIVEPTPVPGAVQRTVRYADWLAASPDHAVGSPIDLNFRAAWQKGVDKFSFDPVEMAFESGNVFEKKAPGAADFELRAGLWSAGTCELTVNVTALGEYISSQGICR